jgi:hypothetical protein
MRRWAIAYSVIAMWAFGWLAGRFGLLPSLFAALVFFIPAVFAWRMVASKRIIKRREYAYLGVVTVLALGATTFVVAKWHDAGMDRLAIFDREYHRFRNRVESMPEYRNVDVSYTHRKGGRVYLHGRVANKQSHERLIQLIVWMVRNNDSGYYDGVDYPGKSTEADANSTRPKRDEQSVAPEPRAARVLESTSFPAAR